MADDLIPPASPQKGGQKKSSDKKSREKRAGYPQKKLVPANINKGAKSEPSLIGVMEALDSAGISTELMVERRLRPGEVGFVIPQKVY